MSCWLVYTDTAGIDIGETNRFILDLAYGSSENDFKIVTPADVELLNRSYIYIPETPWGGYINSPGSEKSGNTSVRVYEGLTWTGILENKRISRNGSVDVKITVEGKLKDVVEGFLLEKEIDCVFEVVAPDIDISFTFYNHSTLYSILLDLCETYDLKMSFVRSNAEKTVMTISEIADADDDGSLDGYGFKILKPACVNHLICLGKDGAVLHLYADESGEISTTQTLFGVDEIPDTYDCTSSEGDELYEKGSKKLKELQTPLKVEIDLPSGEQYDIGDKIFVFDELTGESGEGTIGKAIVNVDKYGMSSVKYQCRK